MTSSLSTVLQGRHLAVVDVEGNGQQPPEVVEIAIVPVQGDDVAPTEMRTWLIRPKTPISALVTRKVHGITNDDVAECPPWDAVASDIEALLANRTLVAHSAHVEHRVLTSHLPNWNPPMVLDTARLAKHVWPELDRYGLDHLIEHAELDTSAAGDQRRHRAGFDAWCAWRLLVVLIEQSQLDWQGLVRTAALPAFQPPDDPEGGLW